MRPDAVIKPYKQIDNDLFAPSQDCDSSFGASTIKEPHPDLTVMVWNLWDFGAGFGGWMPLCKAGLNDKQISDAQVLLSRNLLQPDGGADKSGRFRYINYAQYLSDKAYFYAANRQRLIDLKNHIFNEKIKWDVCVLLEIRTSGGRPPEARQMSWWDWIKFGIVSGLNERLEKQNPMGDLVETWNGKDLKGLEEDFLIARKREDNLRVLYERKVDEIETLKPSGRTIAVEAFHPSQLVERRRGKKILYKEYPVTTIKHLEGIRNAFSSVGDLNDGWKTIGASGAASDYGGRMGNVAKEFSNAVQKYQFSEEDQDRLTQLWKSELAFLPERINALRGSSLGQLKLPSLIEGVNLNFAGYSIDYIYDDSDLSLADLLAEFVSFMVEEKHIQDSRSENDDTNASKKSNTNVIFAAESDNCKQGSGVSDDQNETFGLALIKQLNEIAGADMPQFKADRLVEGGGETIAICARSGWDFVDGKTSAEVISLSGVTEKGRKFRPALTWKVRHNMHGAVRIVGAHAPAPNHYPNSKDWYNQLNKHIKDNYKSEPIVLAGDLNLDESVSKDEANFYETFFREWLPQYDQHKDFKTSYRKGGEGDSMWSASYDKVLLSNNSGGWEPCGQELYKSTVWKTAQDGRRYSDHTYVYMGFNKKEDGRQFEKDVPRIAATGDWGDSQALAALFTTPSSSQQQNNSEDESLNADEDSDVGCSRLFPTEEQFGASESEPQSQEDRHHQSADAMDVEPLLEQTKGENDDSISSGQTAHSQSSDGKSNPRKRPLEEACGSNKKPKRE